MNIFELDRGYRQIKDAIFLHKLNQKAKEDKNEPTKLPVVQQVIPEESKEISKQAYGLTWD